MTIFVNFGGELRGGRVNAAVNHVFEGITSVASVYVRLVLLKFMNSLLDFHGGYVHEPNKKVSLQEGCCYFRGSGHPIVNCNLCINVCIIIMTHVEVNL